MIYISYKFCKDVVYKALEGNEIKLETFVSHNDNCIKMKFVTDKNEEWIVQFDDLDFRKNNKSSYTPLHWFCITNENDPIICLSEEANENIWDDFFGWVDSLLTPIRSVTGKQIEIHVKKKNLEKDFE